MKTKRDIEKLVQWAMREELPKGRAVSASSWDLIMRFATLGVRIDSGGFRDGLGYVPGSPHEDAEKIASAIALLDTRATFAEREEVLPLFGDLAAIAGDGVDAIMQSIFDPRSLVMCHAVQSTRPKWEFETPSPYAITISERNAAGAYRDRARVVGVDAAGEVIDLKPNRGRAAMRDGLYDLAFAPRSPLQWGDPSPLAVAEARAEYLAWHDALTYLAKVLVLDEFEVLPPAAARVPWITGQTPASRVLPGRDLTAGEVQALQPDRRRAGRRVSDSGKPPTVAQFWG
jgi:hypothetical protein